MPHGIPLLSAVLDLPRDDEPIGFGEEALVGRAHDQRRHQVLEHRARPGDERRAARDLGGHAPHPEPVLGRDVALGDREEAREPRFGGEEVVAVRVALAVARQIADRQELALGVEQEAVVHRHREVAGGRGKTARRRASVASPSSRTPIRRREAQVLLVTRDRGDKGLRPDQALALARIVSGVPGVRDERLGERPEGREETAEVERLRLVRRRPPTTRRERVFQSALTASAGTALSSRTWSAMPATTR